MSDSPNSRPRPPAPADGSDEDLAAVNDHGSGVLAGLPRTRPQRVSARRAEARARTSREASRATSGQAADASRVAKPQKVPKTSARLASKRKPAPVRSSATHRPTPRRPTPRRPSSARRVQEPAPRQGFEAEPDSLDGPVQPPGGAELVASAAELAGELAKTGVGAGARLVRDFLSRLPG